MQLTTAIVVDDLAADRRLAALVLRAAGWSVRLARTSSEALELMEQLDPEEAAQTVVVTDLMMPHDPLAQRGSSNPAAGSRLALALRAQMHKGSLPPLPIVGLTAFSEPETHLTALAFGCDAVLTKPATRDLATRIEQALAQARGEHGEVAGSEALLQLLRHQLAQATQLANGPQPPTEGDITRALLAYARHGMLGLGQSTLAASLVPDVLSVPHRGEATYRLLLTYVDRVLQLDVKESMRILSGELQGRLSPKQQRSQLGMSKSEYYRRRKEAIAVLVKMLSEPPAR